MKRRSKPDRGVVPDKLGCRWSVTVTTVDDDDLAHWLELSPEQRLELMTECALDGLRVKRHP